MASSLGTLIVKLGLDAAGYTAGMTKAEVQAKKFAQSIDREFSSIKTASLALAGLGVAAIGAFKLIERGAEGIAAFKTLAEKIGDTSNAVAGLKISAATSGVAMNEIATASVRLTAALAKTNDESTDAGKAIKALGLDLTQFKQLSPVAQLEAIAKALVKFEDGAGKTAVAVALLGRSGAALIPFFNDLAEAGGRNERLTREQIEAADQFTKQIARLKEEVALFSQTVVSDVIPTVSRLLKEFTEGTRIAGGFFEALRLFGTSGLFGTAQESITKIRGEIEEIRKDMAAKVPDIFGFEKQIADKEKQILFIQARIRNAALASISPSNDDARDIRAQQRPGLVFDATTPAKAAKAARERISEAQRYAEQLDKQLERTQELTTVEQVLRDIQMDRIEGLTPVLKEHILLTAQMIDQAKEAKKAAEEQQRLEQESARIREQNSKTLTAQVAAHMQEAVAIRDANDAIKEQIAYTLGGVEALDKLQIAKLDDIIASKKQQVLMLENEEGTQRLVAAINEQIVALEKRQQLTGELRLAEKVREEVEQLQNLKDTFSDALVAPLLDFVNQTKSAKDAFRSFIRSIEAILQQKAARGLADWLFGGKTQGGFDFSTIAKLLSGFVGGGGVAGIGGFSGGGFGEHFATGTSFAPGGRAWVGESGPELVNLPRGSRVNSASSSRAMTAPTMNFNVNVLPGANTHSARQAGSLLRDVVMRAIKEH